MQVAPVLVRTRRTEAQVRLGAAQRLRNIQGAIQVLPGSLVLGKNLIVVDDVVTTGSTLAAGAATLVRAGADTVHALTVAREM
ncbi:MAG: ComF family protein [Chloroflexia bacterium]|nr:ComF family protein [Chloroflexia bacterium]